MTHAPAVSYRPSSLVACLILAVAYWATGKLGLMLAIPPGYATAVWPPSGLALAGVLIGGHRLAPGVLLGSFLINIETALGSGTLSVPLGLFFALVIGLGAMLQAMVGAEMIRRVGGYPGPLSNHTEVISFMILGGPVSCLISATVGVTTLYLFDRVRASEWFYSWWTWWVGDSIGAFSFAPIVLLCWGEPRQLMRPRRLAVGIPLLIGLALSIVLFLWSNQREQVRIATTFQALAAEMAAELEDRLLTSKDVVTSLGAFFSVRPEASNQQFQLFSRRLLERHPTAVALAWVPRVRHADRPAFESRYKELYGARFCIREERAPGLSVPASPREEYLPILFVEPLGEFVRVLGFDLTSEPNRRRALELAWETKSIAATPPVPLVTMPESSPTIILFSPVFSSPQAEEPEGYAVLLHNTETLFGSAWERFTSTGLRCQVVDEGEGGQLAPVHAWPARGSDQEKPYARQVLQLALGGRRWSLDFKAGREFALGHRSLQAWSVLASGALFSGLLVAFLLVVTGHSTEVELEVARRTAELARTNTDLRQARDTAEAASKAKTQLLANVSHELRTPLNGILGMVELLLTEPLEPAQRSKAEIIQSSGEALLARITDLLDVSRLETAPEPLQPRKISLSRLLSEWVHEHRPAARRKGLDLHLRLSCDLPAVVLADPIPLNQALDCLLDNAIKFTPRGNITVRVGVERLLREEVALLFEVEDTGIGIPDEMQRTVFDPFIQVDMSPTRQHGGTGLGLSIVAQQVRRLGGEIEVRSQVGVGSLFYFRLAFRIVQASTPEIAAPIGNTDEVRARFSGRAELLADAVQQFQARRSALEVRLHQALLEANGAAISQIVHEAAEAASVFFAHHIPQVAARIEESIQRGNWVEIETGLRELIFAFDMLQSALADLA